ncbi:MAG: hypothetical protein ACYDGR_03240 [Candidatus Dormibacteria bacterium]
MLHLDPAVVTAAIHSVGAIRAAVDIATPIKTELASPLFDAGRVLVPAGVIYFVVNHMFRHGGEGARTIIAEGALAGGGAMAMLEVVRHLGSF